MLQHAQEFISAPSEQAVFCKHCQSYKPKTAFPKGRKCIDCCRAYNRAYQAGWRKEHAESKKHSAEKWRRENPDYQERWRASNPESVLQSRKRKLEETRTIRATIRAEKGLPPILKRVTSEGRLCGCCRERKPDTAFGKSRVARDGISYTCKECTNLKGWAAWSEKNPEERYKINRRSSLKHNYGMSEEDFNNMLSGQDGKCEICKTPLTLERRQTCVDHCHKSGKVRGLLCVRCNSGLGQFVENISSLKAAIAYLELHETKQ